MSILRNRTQQAALASSRVAAQNEVKVRDNPAGNRSPVSHGHAESDQNQFQSLLNDLSRGPVNESDTPASGLLEGLPEHDGLHGSEKLTGNERLPEDGKFHGSEELVETEGLPDSEEIEDADSSNEGELVSELSMFPDAAPLQNIESSSENQDAAQSASPVNDAATRIIDEMQSRARRNETRRWQFSLPGLMGGEVTVTVERGNDESWNVELTTPESCSDDDRLALAQRLGERLDDVTVITTGAFL